MKEIAFISCVKTKANGLRPAATLYTSALFRKTLLAAFDRTKTIYILSAKHGLLELNDRIEPYDKTLKNMTSVDRVAWRRSVSLSVAERIRPGDRIIFYGGQDYMMPLLDTFRKLSCDVELPLGNLSLGGRLRYLKLLNSEYDLIAMLRRFHMLLSKLERLQLGGRLISACTGRLVWPNRGIYIITEQHISSISRRVVRVGTHAVSSGSKTSLWNRVSTHRGTGTGGGSHRSLIFRSHLGRALIGQSDTESTVPTTWGIGQSAPTNVRRSEDALEKRVSAIIGAMRLLWLDVPDVPGPRSDRAYLERNIIGLLSRAYILGLIRQSSGEWLGNSSDDWRISAGGLWNIDHLFYRPESQFLDVFAEYVDITAGKAKRPLTSIAPEGWGRRKMVPTQLCLFPEVVYPNG